MGYLHKNDMFPVIVKKTDKFDSIYYFHSQTYEMIIKSRR